MAAFITLTNYTRRSLLDHAFGIATYTAPTIYMAIGRSGGGFTGWNLAGTGGTEPVGNGYARTLVGAWDTPTNNDSGSTVSAQTQNTNPIVFPTQTPAGWGTIAYGALFDASSGGNCLAFFNITAGTATVGNQVTFAAGEISVVFQSSAQPTQFHTDRMTIPMMEHLLGISTWSPPSSLYLGMINLAFGGMVSDSYTEHDNGSYARIALGSLVSAYDVGSEEGGNLTGIITRNSTHLAFPTLTAAATGGIDCIGLFDASSGGNLLATADSSDGPNDYGAGLDTFYLRYFGESDGGTLDGLSAYGSVVFKM